MTKWAILVSALMLASCGHQKTVQARAQPEPAELTPAHQVRVTGKVRAVHAVGIQVPQITGQNGRITLTKLIANGIEVHAGDLLAEFDRTQQLDNARQAQAKFEDLSHQADQKSAQNRADAEKRSADLQKAEADLAKAELQLRKGPLLAEIDRLKNEAKAEDARAHVASLKKSNEFHDQADTAALAILKLQRDRQKVAVERAETNAAKLVLKAPLAGRVTLENVWRNGSMGHAQEGDQLWTGQTLVRVFDPSVMELTALVGEPDGALLKPGVRAKVNLDAYPDLIFSAHFESASPVATSGLGSPIKTFAARFRLDQSDTHLLPDLSAAIVILPPEVSTP